MVEEEELLDLTPTPRVLRMLGKIELDLWQCLAELIDNSIDGIRGTGVGDRITVFTPTIQEFDDGWSEVTVIDNGPGMTREVLEKNLKAGFTGNDPISKLGLFGMGFNIATARIGNVTKVMTTQKGDDHWRGVTINFERMEREESFKRPIEREEKPNPEISGTRITIKDLNKRVRTIRRKRKIREKLNRIYTPILEEGDITINLDGEELEGREHCIWSGERFVERRGRRIYTHREIDKVLGEEYYCRNCWNWIDIPPQEDIDTFECPICGPNGDIQQRKQRVKGWVGIQRFFDQEYYGIDLIRNGRVIEELDKSLFYWVDPDTGEEVKEYPIDTTHWGGRIVGEIHIDFVPLETYTKDRFEKHDPRWIEVRNFLRGKGPFQPIIAKEKGYMRNESPLGELFEGFRTGRTPGKKNLVPGIVNSSGVSGINEDPKRWAKKFWEGHSDYLTDEKWYEAVKDAEEALRKSRGGVEVPEEVLRPEGPEKEEEVVEEEVPELELEDDPALTGDYGIGELGEELINVKVSRLTSGDINGPLKWNVKNKSDVHAIYDPEHYIFRGYGTEPIDLILLELTIVLARRVDDPRDWPPPRIFSRLQREYLADYRISPESLAERADNMIESLRNYIIEKNVHVKEEIPDPIKDVVRGRVLDLLGKGEEEVQIILQTTAYLRYAPDEELIRFFESNPEHFFDGSYWERPYDELGTDELRKKVREDFSAYLADVLWLSKEARDYELEEMSEETRNKMFRASYSLQILEVTRA